MRLAGHDGEDCGEFGLGLGEIFRGFGVEDFFDAGGRGCGRGGGMGNFEGLRAEFLVGEVREGGVKEDGEDVGEGGRVNEVRGFI